MVRKIESFRHYSDLTFEAIRKIIKKFDKRFQCRFEETIGMPSTARQLVTAEAGKNDLDILDSRPAVTCRISLCGSYSLLTNACASSTAPWSGRSILQMTGHLSKSTEIYLLLSKSIEIY